MVGRIIIRDIRLQAGAVVGFIDQILNTIVQCNNPSDYTPGTMIELLTAANETSTCTNRLNKKESDTRTTF